MSDEERGIGGRFGKMRKLLDEKVVSKLKDSDTRENVMHQVSEHADTLKDAGMALASRLTGGGNAGEKRAEPPAAAEEEASEPTGSEAEGAEDEGSEEVR